jgi:hypothetical protein
MEQSSGAPKVRSVLLLPGERVVALFANDPRPSDAGPLLALTDRRLLMFLQQDSQAETTVTPLDGILSAGAKVSSRTAKPLVQGVALLVTALVAYLLIGTFVSGIMVAAAVGAIIGIIGLFMIFNYVFWEVEGSVVFRGNGWTASFPYEGRREGDLMAFLDMLFRLKLGIAVDAASYSATAFEATVPKAHESPASSSHVIRDAWDRAGPDAQEEAPQGPAFGPPASPQAARAARSGLADPGVGDDVQR